MDELVTNQPRTTIVNVRIHKCEIYCGRGSSFGNPYNHQLLGITRDECCEMFIPYFYRKLTNTDFRDKGTGVKREATWVLVQVPAALRKS